MIWTPRRAQIRRLLDRWDSGLAQMAQIDAELAPLVAQHAGATALMTIPEVGLCAPRRWSRSWARRKRV